MDYKADHNLILYPELGVEGWANKVIFHNKVGAKVTLEKFTKEWFKHGSMVLSIGWKRTNVSNAAFSSTFLIINWTLLSRLKVWKDWIFGQIGKLLCIQSVNQKVGQNT